MKTPESIAMGVVKVEEERAWQIEALVTFCLSCTQLLISSISTCRPGYDDPLVEGKVN